MKLPSLITDLFDTAARRRKQLTDLETRIGDLRPVYDSLIAKGDDAMADKLAARIMRLQLEAQAGRTAIETAERLAKDQEAAQARAARQQQQQRARNALQACTESAIAFESDLLKLAPRLLAFEEQFEAARAQCLAAGVEIPADLVPMRVWDRSFVRFGQASHREGRSPRVYPGSVPRSRPVESVAQRLSRTAPVARELEEES